MAWTDSEISALKTLLAQGKSARQIMHMLNAGGAAYTRNAVLGKIHRLGLGDGIDPALRKTRNAARAMRENRNRRPERIAKVKIEWNAPSLTERSVALSDRNMSQCPYPVSGDGASLIVCGEPITQGNWCDRCRRIVYAKEAA